jgi:putative transposase
MLEDLPLDPTEASDVAFLDEERTPAWLIKLACAAYISAASLAEYSDLLAWFGLTGAKIFAG